MFAIHLATYKIILKINNTFLWIKKLIFIFKTPINQILTNKIIKKREKHPVLLDGFCYEAQNRHIEFVKILIK